MQPTTAANPTPDLSEHVRTRIDQAPPAHPRLFLDPEAEAHLARKLASDPTLNQARAYVFRVAEALLDVAPVERVKVGRRLLGISRTCLKRVLALSLTYRLTGDVRYADRAQAEMLAAADFTDWNPSHFLDVAEMTAALAIGYDWLYHELDPAARITIREAIIEKGLETSLEGGWWVVATNNWNQVCHGGLTLGALAVMEDAPDLAAQIIERAVANVPRSMAEYAPDGAYPEGPTYWRYGTTYNVLLIDGLTSALGTDFDLTQREGFLASSDYYLHVTGPTGTFFNYSDCGTDGGIAPAMHWFAGQRDKPSLLWFERNALKAFLSNPPKAEGQGNRLFPMLLIWGQPLAETPQPAEIHWKGEGTTPVAMHRSRWDDPQATYVALKGGSPGANHAHMDAGTFVMEAGGVRWASDLGAQSYHDLESQGIALWDSGQDGERWEVFRLNNASHNTLVVEGERQRVDGYAPIVAHAEEGSMPHTIVDLSPVYAGQLAAAQRGAALREDGSVLIQDEIETLAHETSIRWGMVTRADVEIRNATTAILRQGDKRLVVRVAGPAEDAISLETYETADPPHDYDAPNPGTRMLGFTTTLPASTETRWTVHLSPGAEVGERPAVRPLAAW
jgi:hypothetical protein